MKCHGNSELQAVLLANNTAEVVTLTSSRAVYMYPLLGLTHQYAYWFDGDRTQSLINRYKCVTSHKLPGQDLLAEAIRTELGGRRSLGNKQCFVIPLYLNYGGKSEWTMEIQAKSMITWRIPNLGLISGDWQRARQTIRVLEESKHSQTRERSTEYSNTGTGGVRFENVRVGRGAYYSHVSTTGGGVTSRNPNIQDGTVVYVGSNSDDSSRADIE